jgi:hypothetical protein
MPTWVLFVIVLNGNAGVAAHSQEYQGEKACSTAAEAIVRSKLSVHVVCTQKAAK